MLNVCQYRRVAKIVELPSDEPLPGAVEPVLEIDFDLASWVEQREFKGLRSWMAGLGPYLAVELTIDGELLVLIAFEYIPTSGRVIVEARPDLAERETRAVEMLRELGVSGRCTGTATGTLYSL